MSCCNCGTAHGKGVKRSPIESFDSSREELTDHTPLLRRKILSLTEEGKTHWLLGMFILCNAIIGAGILSLPYGVVHSGGLASGLVIELCIGVVSLGSALILGWLTSCRSMKSMQDICGFYLGQKGQTLTSILLVIFYFSVCIAYIVAIREQLASILTANLSQSLSNVWYLDSRFLVSLLVLALIAPLCFLPEIDNLKHISSLASVFVVYIAGMVVAGYFNKDLIVTNAQQRLEFSPARLERLHNPNPGPYWARLFYGFPAFLSAYTFQPTASIVYDSLSPRTYTAYIRAIVIAMVISAVFYNIVVVFAALTLGESLQTHILLNYNAQQPVVVTGSIFYMLKLMLEYPVVHFTAREGILTLIKQQHLIPTGGHKEFQLKIMLASVFIGCTLAVALVIPQVMIVVQFASIANAPLVTIIPGLCLFKKLLEHDHTEELSRGTRIVLWILSVFYIVFGSFFLGLVSVQTVFAFLQA